MGTVYIAPPYVWGIFAVIVVYLGMGIYLWGYLERAHHNTWIKLGSPSFRNFGITNSLRFTGFVFGCEYRSLSDPRLTKIIWSIRGLFALCAALFIIGDIYGLIPPR